ncbi:MAG: anti-sigma factor [Actinomycetaceae bacterium]|nr:anti-sigma factor [Actinomycetaceae bacterium]
MTKQYRNDNLCEQLRATIDSLYDCSHCEELSGLIDDHILDGPDAAARAFLYDHARHCETCQDLLAQEDLLRQLLRSCWPQVAPSGLQARIISRTIRVSVVTSGGGQ